jgi:hypothetical protein
MSRASALLQLCIVVVLLPSCASGDVASSFAPPAAPIGADALLRPKVVQNGDGPLRWRSFASGMPSDSQLTGIVAGPDGTFMWYSNATYGTLGRMGMDGSTRVYALHAPGGQFAPGQIAVGADRKLYIGGCVLRECDVIGVLAGTGAFSVIHTPSGDGPGPYRRLALGPDGNVWFAEGAHIGKITPAGRIFEFTPPASSPPAGSVTAGGDGDVWFDERSSYGGMSTIGRINPNTGKITQLNAHCPFSCAFGGSVGIARSGTGDVYVLAYEPAYSYNYFYLGRFRHNGNLGWTDVTFTQPTTSPIEGPDGAIWWGAVCGFSSGPDCSLARSDPFTQGISTDHRRSTAVLNWIAAGPDGNVWGLATTNYSGPPYSIDVFIRNVLDVRPSSLTLPAPGSRATLTVRYRRPSFLRAASGDPSVATVARGRALGTFVVTGRGAGSTTIVVDDELGNSFDVPVTVP